MTIDLVGFRKPMEIVVYGENLTEDDVAFAVEEYLSDRGLIISDIKISEDGREAIAVIEPG